MCSVYILYAVCTVYAVYKPFTRTILVCSYTTYLCTRTRTYIHRASQRRRSTVHLTTPPPTSTTQSLTMEQLLHELNSEENERRLMAVEDVFSGMENNEFRVWLYNEEHSIERKIQRFLNKLQVLHCIVLYNILLLVVLYS